MNPNALYGDKDCLSVAVVICIVLRRSSGR